MEETVIQTMSSLSDVEIIIAITLGIIWSLYGFKMHMRSTGTAGMKKGNQWGNKNNF